MPDTIDELKKLELLNEARKLLNAEYNKKKSDEYNNWLLKNSNAIKSTNIHLPLPPFVSGNTAPFYATAIPYPSEHDVVAKAVELYNAKYKSKVTAAVPQTTVTEATTQDSTLEEPTVDVEQEQLSQSDELEGLQLRDAMIQEIYNIYGDKNIKDFVVEPTENTKEETPAVSVEELNTIPQPAEELSKFKTTNNSFSSLYQKFQEMKKTIGGL